MLRMPNTVIANQYVLPCCVIRLSKAQNGQMRTPKSLWISVKDDLPCNHKELLENLRNTKMVEVVFQDKRSGKRRVDVRCMTNITTNYYNGSNEWAWKAYWDEDIIYWRPTPEPPKE